MKRAPRNALFAALLALVAIVGCSSGSSRQTKPLPQSELTEYRGCQTDDQCVWVQNGCCDCANGGEDIAVAAAKKDAFRALFDCHNAGCTEMDIQPPCGSGAPKCENGLCVFKETAP